MNNSTVAAISTPHGEGGIGVIRISGSNAFNVIASIFKSAKKSKSIYDLSGYDALLGHIIFDSEIIDEVIVTVYKKPNSYTGEDVVEISCHGGLYIVQRILRAVLDSGAVLAGPGEFTKRAFLNGKMDLTRAEAVMDMIHAKSENALKAAVSLLSGALYKKILSIRENLLDILAHLSAWSDYPDEDIPELSAQKLEAALINNINALEEILSNYNSGQIIRDGIDTVIVGRPNVGKSSLMNWLAHCEKSIVTEIPGTTRDVVEERVVLGNIILNLSDTAGIRESANIIEQAGIEKSKSRLSSCSLVLAVFDGSTELASDDYDLLKLLESSKTIALINKTDLDIKLELEKVQKYVPCIVNISAKQEKGIEDLIKAVYQITGTKKFDAANQIFLYNERQRSSVYNACDALKDVLKGLKDGFTFDAITISLENAVDHLFDLTGESLKESVIERVFQNFCVGK